MAFSAEEILEEFVEASRTRERITPEAVWWQRYERRKQQLREYQEWWRSFPDNVRKKNAYMKAYYQRPEVSVRVKAYDAARRKNVDRKEYKRLWHVANKDRRNSLSSQRDKAKRLAKGIAPRQKLSPETVIAASRMRQDGLSYERIGKALGLRVGSVWRLLNGKAKWVKLLLMG